MPEFIKVERPCPSCGSEFIEYNPKKGLYRCPKCKKRLELE